MLTEPLIKEETFQDELNRLRIDEGYDFAGVALYEDYSTASPIKWRYVSGNLNHRYKMIILRKGRGLAGMVMKTAKRMILSHVSETLPPEEKIKYPILISEELTAVIAIPLCHDQKVYGVLLLGQRDEKPLPDNHNLNISGKLWAFTEEM
ncbi:nitrate respiration regulation accessory nitrate sensor NreA [Staphylococcus sp. NRL 16/872]|uniref:nitrate respiration regulation accessory nitrate sensor NreA n=1 Tax=Staphylococcus sp. NRL 16/872 TaxID=2930131 RepID=UPI001FB2E474|nr:MULTISPECIES: nitrate respiration regulation accessory nitrate sensor NreA [unclassified Staphylococcus]MCJ1655674.1 nitrate respiration regulation accessory nitrate sensor NreA [Staphylococcus sp. NRL 21/187]MCJ1661493.1 nitrate respiration regulation accessory nitrate sensor NreA [Staphylococcus sp. NRL 18/288]MCJ1667402.1 nitrate respiration regulation accessory nitrate sensor NreA [Staphylococcus sp. NRL 19/737]WEN69884.1 nitrate respiration regulation accessory nitrate sensor NreA [Stap